MSGVHESPVAAKPPSLVWTMGYGELPGSVHRGRLGEQLPDLRQRLVRLLRRIARQLRPGHVRCCRWERSQIWRGR